MISRSIAFVSSSAVNFVGLAFMLICADASAADFRFEISRCNRDPACLLKLAPKMEKDLASPGNYMSIQRKSHVATSLLIAYESAGRKPDAERIRPAEIVYRAMHEIGLKISCPDELCSGSSSAAFAAEAEYLRGMGPEYAIIARSAERAAESFGRMEDGSPSTAALIAGAISQSASAIAQARAAASQTSTGPSPVMLPNSAPKQCKDVNEKEYTPPCVDCNAHTPPGGRVMKWDSILLKCVNNG